jgi:hypothetical protein
MNAQEFHNDFHIDYVQMENRARIARAIALRDFVKRLRGKN